MQSNLRSLVVAAVVFLVAGCKKDPADPGAAPATSDGARALLSEFLKPGADYGKLSAALRPTSADYSAIFTTQDMATKAATSRAELWASVRKDPIKPKEGQTELKLWKATTEELRQGKGESENFPVGYKDAAFQIKEGLTVYRWKFVKPGETLGMAYDGLFHVNGHWALIPKLVAITGYSSTVMPTGFSHLRIGAPLEEMLQKSGMTASDKATTGVPEWADAMYTKKLVGDERFESLSLTIKADRLAGAFFAVSQSNCNLAYFRGMMEAMTKKLGCSPTVEECKKGQRECFGIPRGMTVATWTCLPKLTEDERPNEGHVKLTHEEVDMRALTKKVVCATILGIGTRAYVGWNAKVKGPATKVNL